MGSVFHARLDCKLIVKRAETISKLELAIVDVASWLVPEALKKLVLILDFNQYSNLLYTYIQYKLNVNKL